MNRGPHEILVSVSQLCFSCSWFRGKQILVTAVQSRGEIPPKFLPETNRPPLWTGATERVDVNLSDAYAVGDALVLLHQENIIQTPADILIIKRLVKDLVLWRKWLLRVDGRGAGCSFVTPSFCVLTQGPNRGGRMFAD